MDKMSLWSAKNDVDFNSLIMKVLRPRNKPVVVTIVR
jgi:hypothetical protein